MFNTENINDGSATSSMPRKKEKSFIIKKS